MRPDGMPGSCVCLQTSTICSRRSARHQIRGNNIKWHSHVDYIIKKYYQGGLAACNYRGQDWNDQKIMWSKHSSTAWWSNLHNVLCAHYFMSYSLYCLYMQHTCRVLQLRALSRLCAWQTPSLPPVWPPQISSSLLFPSLTAVFPPCHNLSPLGSSAHGV